MVIEARTMINSVRKTTDHKMTEKRPENIFWGDETVP